MKAFIGSIIGIVISLIAFFLLHFDQILLVGQGRAGLLLTLQLNNAVTMYLFGGAIIGAIIGLSNKESV
jgi:hypothetical protein